MDLIRNKRGTALRRRIRPMTRLEPPTVLDSTRPESLVARRLGIDTHNAPIVYLRKDNPVCRSEGFNAMSRLQLKADGRVVIATLAMVEADNDWLSTGEIGLSNAAWRRLGVCEGASVAVSHAQPVASLAHVRGRLHGQPLDAAALSAIMTDVVAGRYNDVELATFLAACSARELSLEETIALTRAMVDSGQRVRWPARHVYDKHGVGGLPGNRTTPILVSIVAAAGHCIPKTSSRAITSPSGTADTVETLMPVALSLAQMREVVAAEGGCLVWGGSVDLSPADDTLIRVERALNIDSVGQLVASVLSKKIAAGATDVLLDLPIGPSAKVRSSEAAVSLSRTLTTVGEHFGLNVRCHHADGRFPVGVGIGPANEARDVLAVLQGLPDAPTDLRDRALGLAALLLEMAGRSEGEGLAEATRLLQSGAAWRKFLAIAEAQGGLREPAVARYRLEIAAESSGQVVGFDNRRLSMLAKLAGAPGAQAAGLLLKVRPGDRVDAGDPLLTITAESRGELDYALRYANGNPDFILIKREPDAAGTTTPSTG